MERRCYKKCIMISLILFITIILLPSSQAETYNFSDAVVILVGRCNNIESTGLWIFGLTGIFNREVNIHANDDEGEVIHLFVISSEIGFFFSKEQINVHMKHTKGILFSGEKAFLLKNNPQRVFAFCKSDDIWITI